MFTITPQATSFNLALNLTMHFFARLPRPHLVTSNCDGCQEDLLYDPIRVIWYYQLQFTIKTLRGNFFGLAWCQYRIRWCQLFHKRKKVQNHNELCDPNSFENCSDVDKSADFVWDLLSCPVLVFVPWICKTSSIYWSVQSVAWYITFLGKKRYLCIDIVDTYKFRCSHLYSRRVLVSLRIFSTAFEMKWCEALSM